MNCVFATKSINPALQLCKNHCHVKTSSIALPGTLEQLLDREGIQDALQTSLRGDRLRILRRGCL